MVEPFNLVVVGGKAVRINETEGSLSEHHCL